MNNYNSIRRLSAIVNIIMAKPKIAKSEILENLQLREDIQINKRTLERDFQTLRNNFYLDIVYDRTTNGYFLDLEMQHEIEAFLKFTEFFHLGKFMQEGLLDLQHFKEIVDLDDSSVFKGIQHLRPILLAIRQNQKLSFDHLNYWNDTRKPYTISPLKIKEYLNRWYIIGVPDKSNDIRTFGIDRLEELTVSGGTQIMAKDYQRQLDKFLNIVGLNFNEGNGKVKKIELKVYSKHLQYLKSLPLHPSQKINWQPDKDYGIVTYYLIPNYEFKVQILKMGSFAEVLSPFHLRRELKEMLEKALANYG